MIFWTTSNGTKTLKQLQYVLSGDTDGPCCFPRAGYSPAKGGNGHNGTSCASGAIHDCPPDQGKYVLHST